MAIVELVRPAWLWCLVPPLAVVFSVCVFVVVEVVWWLIARDLGDGREPFLVGLVRAVLAFARLSDGEQELELKRVKDKAHGR